MVAAPGVGILSTTAPGRYERYDGTSMATPHVAGLAALLWAVHPNASLAQVRKAILDSGVRMAGVEYGRIDAARALAALDQATGGSDAALKLSRTSLTFNARPGRVPKAQTISIRTDGGGTRAFTATADQRWIVLAKTTGETPARVAVRIDPAGLVAGSHEGHVSFKSQGSDTAVLKVTAIVGNAAAVAVTGAGCELREGRLHVRAGAGCSVHAAEGEAAAVQWELPGGVKLSGGHLYGQFVRRGEFQVLLSSDEGAVDALPVVIE
jgi:hypothetical protein